MISNYLWECINIQKELTDFLLKALEAFDGLLKIKVFILILKSMNSK